MDREQLIRRLMGTFLDEIEDHVAAWNADLLALEKSTDPTERSQRLQALFRTAHSIKGAARVVEQPLIERVFHQLESLLGEMRAGDRPLDAELMPLLLQAGDALAAVGKELRAERPIDRSGLSELLPRLVAVYEGSPPPAAAGPLPLTSPAREERAAGAGPASSATANEPPPSEAQPPTPAAQTDDESAGWTPPTLSQTTEPVAVPSLTGSLRVGAEKVDSLLADCGELLVTSHRMVDLIEQADQLRHTLQQHRGGWRRKLRRPLRQLNGPSPDGQRTQAAAVELVMMDADRQLGELERRFDVLAQALARDGRSLMQASQSIDDQAHRLRMTGFGEACSGLDRVVRDLSKAQKKRIELRIVGGDVELDRAVLAMLADPLRHLVRNAVDHAIEPEGERLIRGKPQTGVIEVAAHLAGSQVEITVSDDGSGLDMERIRQLARGRAEVVPSSEAELAHLIFQPGFTTAPIITDISGRGVGLDVVRSQVEALHGTIEVSSVRGRGTTFRLIVPLTVTTIRSLLVEAGGQLLALASTNVVRLHLMSARDLVLAEGRELMRSGESPIPIAPLDEVLSLPASQPTDEAVPVVVLTAGGRRVGFVVDTLRGEQEVVIKGLGTRLVGLRLLGGATILPTGEVVLILNAAELIRRADVRAGRRPLANRLAVEGQRARRRVLVVDDSITTRTLEQSILEAAGYTVLVASDGEQAWQILQSRGADLVVADIEMPRMDGFTLTETIRRSSAHGEVPVVLVTTLDSEANKARGMEVGANAYLVKSAFDQSNLLSTIEQLL